MRAASLALALLGSVVIRSGCQAVPDTVLTARGFLERADSGGGWSLLLPQPVTVAGRRVNLLAASGNDARWGQMQDRFVEASGRVEVGPTQAAIRVESVREIQPDGMSRATVNLSFNQNAVVTLAAIPNRFVWQLPDGRPSGVQPLLMYTILNHGQTELEFLLTTNEVVCATVRKQGDQDAWRTSLPGRTQNRERIVIRLGGIYRRFVPVPPEAAPRPGHYIARVTLCGVADYVVETQFEVGTSLP